MNPYLNFSLEGKVALVTGASYGIGFAIASAFAEQGAKICFNDINQELVDKGLASYKEKGIDVHGYVCDVTDEPAVQAMVAQIEKEVGPIDILVNNAGIIRRIPMHEMAASEFRKVIDIDLNAPFIVSKAVLPGMMERKHGKIINICSMMSELGRETVSAYAAAKGGLKMLTRNICSEYGEYNIQCNGIGPGYIATPQTAPLRERQPDGSRHPFDSFICAKTPAGRWLDPQELTGPAVFLASEASNAVNGHILYVLGKICLGSCLHSETASEEYGVQICFKDLILRQFTLKDDRVICFLDLTAQGTLIHLVAKIKISCQLLGDGACPAYLAAAEDGVFDGAVDPDYVKSAVGPECLVLKGDKSVLYMFWDLVYLNDGPVLISICRINDLAFIIIKYGAL